MKCCVYNNQDEDASQNAFVNEKNKNFFFFFSHWKCFLRSCLLSLAKFFFFFFFNFFFFSTFFFFQLFFFFSCLLFIAFHFFVAFISRLYFPWSVVVRLGVWIVYWSFWFAIYLQRTCTCHYESQVWHWLAHGMDNHWTVWHAWGKDKICSTWDLCSPPLECFGYLLLENSFFFFCCFFFLFFSFFFSFNFFLYSSGSFLSLPFHFLIWSCGVSTGCSIYLVMWCIVICLFICLFNVVVYLLK